MKASVIISVYNKPQFLALVVAGFTRQTESDFELIISDDGSNDISVAAYKVILDASGIKWQHCWHEDIGFRKNRMLNKSIMAAKSDYLIFIDGDCIPHKGFVAEHLQAAAPATCLAGRRTNLSEKLSLKLTAENVANGYLEKLRLLEIIPRLFIRDSMVEKGWYYRNAFLRKWANSKPKGIVGCNFSVYKADILKLNGFDTRYKQPSIGEDTDIEYRMRLLGMHIKTILNMAVQYHLYHKLLPRPKENELLFRQIQTAALGVTPFGITQQMAEWQTS